ncbi:MAG: hypothetical protein P8Z36_17025 [Gemmatimonadota bacterium]
MGDLTLVRRGRAWGVGVLGVVFALACAGHHAPPTAASPKPPPPDMTGVKVMLLPAQVRGVALPGLDTELAYWLGERAPRTQWVLRPAMEHVLKDTPEWSINLDALAVGQFGYMEVKRIGEPLFTDLRRLSALLDARFALLPVAAGWVAGSDSAPGAVAGDSVARNGAARGHVEIAAAVIDTLTGTVLWYGVVAGEPSARPDRAAIASAAQELARVLVP